MICDEVQCGMGRTGSMFAWQALWYQTGYYDYGKSNRKRNSGRSVCNDRRRSRSIHWSQVITELLTAEILWHVQL